MGSGLEPGVGTPGAAPIADVGYTAGFYRATAPSHLAFAALATGRSPGRARQPRRVLELGFGQGFGLALLAAANPDVAFEGCDFNAEHVANARALADAAGLANVSVTQASFEGAASQDGDPDVDVIVLHGVFSWVSRATQDAILAIVRRRLAPGGFVYVSYNCLPGWAPVAPIRELIGEVARRHGGDSEQRVGAALDVLRELRARNALYFAANPAAARHFDEMLGMDRRYLAHEYLDENWRPLWFSEAVEVLGAAGLSFLASATLCENLDGCAAPGTVMPVLARAADPVMREILRDFAANKQFRRDVFVLGGTGFLPDDECRRMLSEVRFTLAVPRGRVVLKFFTPLGEVAGRDDVYRPVLDAMAVQPAGFDELLGLPAFGERGFAALVECLTLLVHSGQLLPLVAPPPEDVGAARRFNGAVIERARAGQVHDSLASPVTRTGIPVTDFGLLALSALFDGAAETADATARHALAALQRLGRRPHVHGQAIDDDGAALALLAERLRPVIEESVPLWRGLGMI